MRCLSCDRKLSDYESTRKYASSGTFVDLCNRCFAEIAEDIPDIEGDIPQQEDSDTEDGTDYDDHPDFRYDYWGRDES